MAAPYLNEVRKLRFYKEIDSSQSRYKIKFKRDKLQYTLDFNSANELKAIAMRIEPVDIPNDSYSAIKAHLSETFNNYKVRKIEQQYPREAFASSQETFEKAFQNLILPTIQYNFVVRSQTEEGKLDWEVLFDSEGEFLAQRKSLPPNYDHVLY